MRAADCYVSLHRAEGFGYTLAEAMWLAKPVIATGYSGTLDYMTAENSYLVDYTLVPIGPGHEPYPADGEWAEPDVEDAARHMRHVFDHPDEAALRGERAACDIRASHAPEVAGRVMAQRLELLLESAGAGGLGSRRNGMAALTTGRVSQLISQGPGPPFSPASATRSGWRGRGCSGFSSRSRSTSGWSMPSCSRRSSRSTPACSMLQN